MNATDLVARLDKVRMTGPGRWIGACPAHDDRNPSLAIRELEDGRVLVHDFAGCAVADIVAAVGLTLSDLFPERLTGTDYKPQPRRGIHPQDALAALAHEARVVLISARTLAAGEPLSGEDMERLAVAARRVTAALDVAHA